ncbi:AAA family ATPase [Microbacterium lacus]|uniref:AAA family ATPase n=1 Tax=Microbacterium lacus TaxID=415217 RepID=UPI000C2C2B33|nr:AAA family ATPase [Microbacterium lacus]
MPSDDAALFNPENTQRRVHISAAEIEARSNGETFGGPSVEERRLADVEARVRSKEIELEAQRRITERVAKSTFGGFMSLSLGEALLVPREVKPAIISGLQMQGHKATLTAGFKAGKTTLSGNVVRSLADNEPFLGRFPVMDLPGNIGILDYELTDDDALDMYGALGVRNTNRIFLESLRGTGFSLANGYHRDLAVKWLILHDICYWVMDPFGRALRGFGSENDNNDVRVFLDAIDEIVKEAGVLGTLMPVHTGRAQHEIGAEHGRGATVLDDDADARWLLTKDAAGRRFFRAEGRSGVGLDEVSLDFDSATARLTTGTVTRDESKGERYLSVVEDHIAANPGLGLNELRDAKLCGNPELSSAIKLGEKRGTIRITYSTYMHLFPNHQDMSRLDALDAVAPAPRLARIGS